ncbi:hypothetical protein MtrunA17_Chr5g0405461 [Medicago truncatula]|uniref:F-box protein interaction domain protein n=1 Tax=Medicago truncatula TaxID=3880 RepID=A0A396HSF5_MEDTR|nr:hypothetical protein MtrunA17_Chr5g0405461 [Medicago truncatula]
MSSLRLYLSFLFEISFGENGENSNRDSQRLNFDFKPDYDKFGVANSCNGMLCLCCPFEGHPLLICNPLTGEFIRLHEATLNTHDMVSVPNMLGQVGLGFQPKTNEYKVIRIWRRYLLDDFGFDLRLRYPTCINGALHWIGFEGQEMSILCFCLETEKLQSFPSPPVFQNHNNGFRCNKRIHMGKLRGLLYICDTYPFRDVAMWDMNEYGIGESWTKVYNIDIVVRPVSPLGRPDSRHYGLCWPVKHFEEGAAILLYHSCNCLIYYEPEKHGFKVFRIHGTSSEFVEIIPHVPSLISLKDVVKGDNIEVLNIHSRCANVELREENEVLSLSQQI